MRTNTTIYRRSESNWIGNHQSDKSATYWRAEAKKAFANWPDVEAVEIVKTGRKTDSALLRRGSDYAPAGFAVVVASTGGSWGKSRRNFYPRAK